MKQLINYLLGVALFMLTACGSEELEINFTINDRDLLPDSEITGTPDADSPDNYILRVATGENLKLIDQSIPARSVEKRFWFLNEKEIGPASRPSIFSHRPTTPGTQTVKLCINEVKPANCVQKFIYVRPLETPEPIADLTGNDVVDKPALPSRSTPNSQEETREPKRPNPPKPPSIVPDPPPGKSSIPSPPSTDNPPPVDPEPVDPPNSEDDDSWLNPEPPPKEKPDPPTPPTPPTSPAPEKQAEKELTTSATTGFSYKDFSADCGAYTNSGSLTIFPQRDIELRAVVIQSDNCGSLSVSLRGPGGVNKTLSYSLSGATQTINLRDFRTRLKEGQTYTLNLSASTSVNCENPNLKPGLGGIANCAGTPRKSSEVRLAYPDNLIFYDLQYYY